jgi:polar amino acid transport system ATP-binding protein
MAILEVANLSKHFGASEVLTGVGFSVERGEALAIIGASGSGKTTLLRCLNFLEIPDKGSIRVGDEVIFDAADPNTLRESEIRRKRLHFGLVFQSFNLFPQYTALRNISLPCELLAKERPDYKERRREILKDTDKTARALLERVGLLDKAGFYPHQLSGGQQQRVAIARALALNPDILCFDEPTSALDPELTGEVLKVIRGLADKSTTMVIVTHEMQFAREVSDMTLFIDGGAVIEYGSSEELFSSPKEERTRRFLERYSNE